MFQIQIYHQKAQLENIKRLRGLSLKVRASLVYLGSLEWGNGDEEERCEQNHNKRKRRRKIHREHVLRPKISSFWYECILYVSLYIHTL